MSFKAEDTDRRGWILTLLNVISLAPTMSEFMQTLEKAAKALRDASEKNGHRLAEKQQYQHHKATIATLAGLDLFMRFVTRNSHDFSVSMTFGVFQL